VHPKSEQDIRGNDSAGGVIAAVCEMGCVTYIVTVETDTQHELIFKDTAASPAELAINENLVGELEGVGFSELSIMLVLPASVSVIGDVAVTFTVV